MRQEGATRPWLVVVVFLSCFTLSYMDRQVISLVVGPLKEALSLSDTQVGLIQGFAFAICYAITGLPLAWGVDRSHRAGIAAACVGAWSVATMSCGLARTYAAFLAARAGTAVAEAGLPPAALSIISDIFPPSRIARASALFMAGPYIGTGFALGLGGLILEALSRHGGMQLPGIGYLPPWKALFVCVGAPGLLLSLLVLLLVREPRRRELGGTVAGPLETSALRFVFENRHFFVPLILGTSFLTVILFAQIAWLPTYYVRTAGRDPAAVGKMMGVTYLVAGLCGSLLSAAWVSSGPQGGTLHQVLRIMTIAGAVLLPVGTLVTLLPGLHLSLVAFGISVLCCSMIVALAPVPLQLVSPSRVRGRIIVAAACAFAVLGAGGGPFIVGFLTDAVLHDEHAVGVSLAVTAACCALLGVGFLMEARYRWRAMIMRCTSEVPS